MFSKVPWYLSSGVVQLTKQRDTILGLHVVERDRKMKRSEKIAYTINHLVKKGRQRQDELEKRYERKGRKKKMVIEHLVSLYLAQLIIF